MRSGSYGAWEVREEDFPRAGSVEDQLRFLLRYAVLAPSAHNTQPWAFAVEKNHVAVHLNESRALRVSDPTGRELVVSVGACLANLLLAAGSFGFRVTVEEFPSRDRTVAADLSFVRSPEPPPEDQRRLFTAIPRRHTNRALFESRPLPPGLLLRFRALAPSGDPELTLVDDPAKIQSLAEITGNAVAESMRDAAFRAELSQWVRTNFTREPDGMPGFAVGIPDVPSLLGPFLVKLPLTAKAEAKKRRAQVASSPLLAIVSTKGDGPREWLRAGIVMENLWLAAVSEGLRVGVLAAAVETADRYRQLQKVLGKETRPQAFLRIGYGPEDSHPTPRRPAEDVTVREAEWD